MANSERALGRPIGSSAASGRAYVDRARERGGGVRQVVVVHERGDEQQLVGQHLFLLGLAVPLVDRLVRVELVLIEDRRRVKSHEPPLLLGQSVEGGRDLQSGSPHGRQQNVDRGRARGLGFHGLGRRGVQHGIDNEVEVPGARGDQFLERLGGAHLVGESRDVVLSFERSVEQPVDQGDPERVRPVGVVRSERQIVARERKCGERLVQHAGRGRRDHRIGGAERRQAGRSLVLARAGLGGRWTGHGRQRDQDGQDQDRSREWDGA